MDIFPRYGNGRKWKFIGLALYFRVAVLANCCIKDHLDARADVLCVIYMFVCHGNFIGSIKIEGPFILQRVRAKENVGAF